MKTQAFTVHTSAGHTGDWANIPVLVAHADNLNQVGYSGKFNGEKITYHQYFEKYVNTPRISFGIKQTKFDNGSFQEEYEVSMAINTPKTADEFLAVNTDLRVQLVDAIKSQMDAKNLARISPKEKVAYEYGICKENNIDIIEVHHDGTIVVPTGFIDIDELNGQVIDEWAETDEASICDVPTDELISLLRQIETDNFILHENLRECHA